jgi:hypothetical protein
MPEQQDRPEPIDPVGALIDPILLIIAAGIGVIMFGVW